MNNQPLNETEENQLKEVLLTISKFEGMTRFGWIDGRSGGRVRGNK